MQAHLAWYEDITAVNVDCNSRLGQAVTRVLVKLVPECENEPPNLVEGEVGNKKNDPKAVFALLLPSELYDIHPHTYSRRFAPAVENPLPLRF